MSFSIPDTEFGQRIAGIQMELARRGLDALIRMYPSARVRERGGAAQCPLPGRLLAGI
jgi:hypothetical protein